ncbi:hypothetical protein L5515_019580 [Caenorhabditis briggsae]|uniref:Uncharacterized protein n=1 Tax=Caenorhabditis briggsae TaxID=6238 RepID=A0AAE9JVL1_CAEBR|nr:hypothetical protein L5515_019580 [Caenorhabditis briggsae]
MDVEKKLKKAFPHLDDDRAGQDPSLSHDRSNGIDSPRQFCLLIWTITITRSSTTSANAEFKPVGSPKQYMKDRMKTFWAPFDIQESLFPEFLLGHLYSGGQKICIQSELSSARTSIHSRSE